jgi:hypothetical protein
MLVEALLPLWQRRRCVESLIFIQLEPRNGVQ